MKRWLIIGGGVAVLGIAWYALSPLWRNIVVDDALPVAPLPSAELPGAGATPGDAPALPSQPAGVTQYVSDPVPVVATPLHPASGQVRVIKNAAGSVVRYENYKTINGPDLLVYLAKDLEAKEYVDLGPLKGTEGNINYPVPAGVNVDDYRYVLTWCEDFAILFNSADLWAGRADQQ